VSRYPVSSGDLRLPGVEERGHVFHLRLEEPVEDCLALRSGRDVRVPWLRACCSCGWAARDDQRTSLEENSHWRWLQHARAADAL
jgi:hypothetical protein